MIKLVVTIGFLLLNAYVYHVMARNPFIPERESFAEFPMRLGEWACPDAQTISDDILANLGATDYLACVFRHVDGRDSVDVYVGYHETQVREEGGGAGENSIHPPAHCLPGSGWDIIANETVELGLPGLPEEDGRVKRLVIAKGNARQLVYYWYQSRGRVIADDWKKILYVGWDRGTKGRTDGSLIRFTVPIRKGEEDEAERAFRDIAPLVLERLDRYVPV